MNNYDYPMGADNSSAPWNQSDIPEREVEVCVSITLSKTVKVYVDDYDFDEDDRGHIYPDFSNCDLKRAVDEQYTLPQDMALFLRRIFNDDLDLRAAKMPKSLRDAVDDCSDWNVDDFEVVLE